MPHPGRDLAHALGKSDAQRFADRMQVSEPIAKLASGPIHFAHSGWAFVEIHPDARPAPDASFYIRYDHPYSFESQAWLAAGAPADFPVCIIQTRDQSRCGRLVAKHRKALGSGYFQIGVLALKLSD